MTSYIKKLEPYLPTGTAPTIVDWIIRTECQFRIAKRRKTKLGDYRAPFKDQGHRISVNHDLNPYAFLITTVHEFAHLKTWNEHKNLVRPHGKTWKKNFMLLMKPFLDNQVFPHDVKLALTSYLANPAAASCTDLNLFRVLQKYDQESKSTHLITVENIPDGAHFLFQNKRVFQKIHKLRKRYRCVEVSSQRIYLFSPVAEVSLYPKK